MYKDYKKFLIDIVSDPTNPLFEQAKQLMSKPFLGFDSNRFGRLAELSALFLEHLLLLIDFFEQFIDENQNKLHLACFCHLKSEWFKLCCQIINELNEILVQPMQLALGIDKYRKVRSKHRSWHGLKELIPDLLQKLNETSNPKSAIDQMKKKVFSEVKVAVERQIATVKFLSETEQKTCAKKS